MKDKLKFLLVLHTQILKRGCLVKLNLTVAGYEQIRYLRKRNFGL